MSTLKLEPRALNLGLNKCLNSLGFTRASTNMQSSSNSKNKNLEFVFPPINYKPIGSKWAFKVKKYVKEEVIKHKAILIIN